ncbi:nucleotide exchange factor GrpE [Nostoc spongiaeforme FACHB-130]|uniref:Nucleotide exchange factor GrpE n=1 Tax=Nostoc spongiaeforme FACHB-130 TaxID=1357510 RepID=A0ABR8G5Q5_9NOSO|nr:nucleotide exchange factor GrpE [Nostoc spongiaeforme]MBD2598577.1 nucleotide exchange factor GrpE [Nostoc spongiaeforme FACHB-130]
MKSAELKDRPRGTGHLPSAEHGKLFDSQIMYAVGLEVKTHLAENTVIQEVVKGYLWDEKVLREAQVIVATQIA